MDTVHASAKRVSPWLPWLTLTSALATAWACMSATPLDLLPSEAAAGSAVLLVFTAVMWTRWRELAHGGGVALLGMVGWIGARLSTGWLPTAADTIGAGGLALIPYLAYRARTRSDEAAQRGADAARLGVAFLLLTPTALAMAYATIPLLPKAWDATAYAIDTAFPVHAFHVGRALGRWPLLVLPARVTYDWIFRFVPGLVALRLCLPKPPAADLLVISIVVCLVGQLGYFVTPIVGPAYAFGQEFPATLPSLEHLPMRALPVPPFLRNGMPSLHMAWALVFLWNTRPFSFPVRAFGMAVVFFTVVATLGFGEHYVIDLVAAVPYAAAAQVAGTRVSVRWRTRRVGFLLVCVALALGWIAAPHFAFHLVASAPWVIVVWAVLTVGVALTGEAWLARAAEEWARADEASVRAE